MPDAGERAATKTEALGRSGRLPFRILAAVGARAGDAPAPDGVLGLQPGRRSRIFRAAALIIVAYPIAMALETHVAPLDVLLGLVATGLFGVLFVAVGTSRILDPRRSSALVVLANLALVALAAALTLTARQSAWFVAFYYASASASLIRPRERAVALMTIEGVIGGACVFLVREDATTAVVQAVSVAVVGFVIMSVAEIRRTNAMLLDARRELATLAVADERNRIARDLHDTLGHTLSLIALKSELAGRLIATDPNRAQSEISDVERVAREALASVRETVRGYRMPTLRGEIASARTALASADIQMHVEADVDPLPASVDAVLAWTIREAITNVIRHSGARRVTIRVRANGGWATAEIIDDGGGAGPAISLPGSERADPSGAGGGSGVGAAGGSGLAGLSERIAALGGAFEAASPPEGGFRLGVRLPLQVGA